MCAAVAAVGADARWLAALGGLIVEAGRIPSSIPYAAAPSPDWVNVPVLGELIFHGLTAVGGDRALVVAQALAVAAMLTIVAREMRAAGATDASRALVLLAIPIAGAASVFIVRAQLFSLPLFALTVALLRTESREPTRRIWWLVPLVALWSNLHGAVLTGLAVASVYLVLDRTRHERWTALGVLVAAWGALFATPALARTPEYYSRVLQSEPAASGFGMWGPLSLRRPLDVLFVVVALSLLWLAMRARLKGWELVCLVLLIAAAVHSSRNSIWLLLFIATPAACGMRLGSRATRRSAAFTCAWLLLGVMALAALVRTPTQTVAGTSLRAEATRLAAGQPILADAENAEQLALDGRRVWIANPIDAFPRADQRAYLWWLEGKPGGDTVLRGQNVVLVQLDSNAQERLAHSAAFREVARDKVAVLYRRAS
jgi:hypothetical protein